MKNEILIRSFSEWSSCIKFERAPLRLCASIRWGISQHLDSVIERCVVQFRRAMVIERAGQGALLHGHGRFDQRLPAAAATKSRSGQKLLLVKVVSAYVWCEVEKAPLDTRATWH
eukprot:3231989-Amphidinium_carterae.1